MSDSTLIDPDDERDLRDPVLQRALENAPDQAAAPDWRLGESIRAMAHEAVAPSLPEAPVGAQRPWWQRLLGLGAGGGAMPWNAAFATVLVGVLVTLMWQREPVPGAQLDGVQEKAAPAASSTSPAPPMARNEPVPVAPAAATAPAPAPAPAAVPSPSTLEGQLAASRQSTAAASRALDQEEAQARQRQIASEREAEVAAALSRQQEKKKALSPPPSGSVAQAPARPSPAAAPPVAASPAPVPPAPAAAAMADATVERREFSAPQAARAAAPAVAAGVAPPAGAAVEAAAPPSFAALSQWTHLRITRPDGEIRRLPRAEARELGALLGSAALAGVGPQPLGGRVDWRIAFERNGEVLAMLELSGGRVRWRENTAAAGTGAPGTGALTALRAALEQASAGPSPAR